MVVRGRQTSNRLLDALAELNQLTLTDGKLDDQELAATLIAINSQFKDKGIALTADTAANTVQNITNPQNSRSK